MNRQIVIVSLVTLALVVTSSGVRGAGTNAPEEAAIRKLIAAYDEPGGNAKAPRLPDYIFWSGAFKRPFVAPEKGVPFTGARSVPNRVPVSQKAKTEVIRIVVADSRDLAYEYSKSTLEFDLKTGQHVNSFDAGVLRVWQKQGADWKIAATFMRPYDREFVAP